ncbi:MAG: hypothetical protein M0P59_05110 [Gallionella sp.]|jgi:ABC-type transporter Mla subunit MlaD|nr:hypothetical protein [Gallionella sp.]MCK9353522.1 hypothetical protein [Gallionella sp.]
MSTLINLPLHIYIFAGLLGLLFLSFVFFFLIPSFIASRQLARTNSKLKELNGKPDGSLDQIFHESDILEHLWQEYADTLHKQHTDEPGPAVRFRSTVPAGMVFRPDILVDIPLRTDFFKHLPGLFTGIGIIGTFYGLLLGLQSFAVSDNPVIVRASLSQLLNGVSEAFLVSAAAITLAMAITFVEKLAITRLNAKVETLVQLLDGLFVSGAGEEYLARLVRASETSSAQTAGLLKGELKQILTELTERQIAATNAGTQALGDRIAASIEETMKAPLLEMANALKNTSNSQESAVQTMLTSVLENFSRQMKDLFGGQMTGINSLQQQTIDALQSAVATLERMAADVGAEGQRSTSAMAEQLAESIAASESRQRIMNEQLGEFVEQMRQIGAQSQNEAQEKLQSTLTELSERMSKVIDGLSTQVRSATEVSMKQQQSLTAQSENIVGKFGEQAAAMVDGMNRAVGEMKAAVVAMRNTTGDAMSKLNNGADTLYLAAKDFAKAGQGVTATLDKSSALATQLTQAAGSVSSATKGLSGMLADYNAARDSMIAMVGSLQLLVEQIRRDASMSGDVIARIEAATEKLVGAQKEAESYLTKVSEVIGTAHESFSEGMTKAVGEANREFHQALSDSVKLLREGIQELESTLDAATSL